MAISTLAGYNTELAVVYKLVIFKVGISSEPIVYMTRHVKYSNRNKLE